MSEKRRFFTRDNMAVISIVIQFAAVLIGGICNILYGLNVDNTVDTVSTAVVSVCVIAVYAASALLVYAAGRRDYAALQTVVWGISLFGFVFYAMDNIFYIPIVTPAGLNMTAFIRFMTVVFTLPVMAYNILIAAIPWVWLAFIVAAGVPAGLFVFYLVMFVKYARNK